MRCSAAHLVSHGSLHCLRHRCCLALPKRYQDDLAGLQELVSLLTLNSARQPQLDDMAHGRKGSTTGVRHHAALSGQMQARYHARSLSWLAVHVKRAASQKRIAHLAQQQHMGTAQDSQAESNQTVSALGATRDRACRMVATPMEMA